MPVLTLDEAKLQLNIPASDTSHDVELADFVAAACLAVEHYTGPADDKQVVEQLRLGSAPAAEVLLTTRPLVGVVSVTSSEPGGVTYDPANMDVDKWRGILTVDAGPLLTGRVTVTYTAGNGGIVPKTANIAARVILQHLWSTQRGGSRRPSARGGDDVVEVPGVGYAVPRAAVQMLETLPHRVDQEVSVF